jgi:hypothetical protein
MKGHSLVEDNDKLVKVYECHPGVLGLCEFGAFIVPVRLCWVLWTLHVSKVHNASVDVRFQKLLNCTRIAVLSHVELLNTNISMICNEFLNVLDMLVLHEAADCNCALPLPLEGVHHSYWSSQPAPPPSHYPPSMPPSPSRNSKLATYHATVKIYQLSVILYIINK